MKLTKIFAIASVLILAVSITSFAQLRVVNTGVVPQGQFIDFGGLYPQGGTVNPLDSLQVSDSIAYLVPVQHTNNVFPYMTWFWNKIGAGTATITLTFLQSNDNVNWFAVPQGAAKAAYTKSYTLAASTWSNVSFKTDTATFEGRYMKVYFITSNTASVKGKLFNRLKVTY